MHLPTIPRDVSASPKGMQADADIFYEMGGSDPGHVLVYERDVVEAVRSIKKPWALDHAGVLYRCVASSS